MQGTKWKDFISGTKKRWNLKFQNQNISIYFYLYNILCEVLYKESELKRSKHSNFYREFHEHPTILLSKTKTWINVSPICIKDLQFRSVANRILKHPLVHPLQNDTQHFFSLCELIQISIQILLHKTRLIHIFFPACIKQVTFFFIVCRVWKKFRIKEYSKDK